MSSPSLDLVPGSAGVLVTEVCGRHVDVDPPIEYAELLKDAEEAE